MHRELTPLHSFTGLAQNRCARHVRQKKLLKVSRASRLARWSKRMRADPAHDVSRTHGASLAGDLAAIFEQRQRGNAANIEARAEAWDGLGIYLDQPHKRLQLGGCLLVSGRHLPAGPAPWRPKVDQNCNLVARNVFVKSCFVQRRRVLCKHLFFTAAARRVAGKLAALHPVGGVAVGANNVQGFGHGQQVGAG